MSRKGRRCPESYYWANSNSTKELLSCYGHALDTQRGSCDGATEFQVAADHRDVAKHVFQIAGHSDFFDGKGELAVIDPQARGSASNVSGHEVHSESQELGDVEPGANIANDLLRRLLTRLQVEIARADSGISGQPASGISGGLKLEFAGGVGIQQVTLQHSALDHDGAACGHTFAVEGRGAKAAHHGAIVDDSDVVARDLLT